MYNKCTDSSIPVTISLSNQRFPLTIFYGFNVNAMHHKYYQNSFLTSYQVELPIPNQIGSYKVISYVTNQYGTSSSKESITFSVTKTLPSVHFAQIPKPQYTNKVDSQIEIHGNLQGCNSYTDDKIRATFIDQNYEATMYTNSFSIFIPLSNSVKEGEYRIFVSVYDTTQSSQVQTFVFKYLYNDPEITLVSLTQEQYIRYFDKNIIIDFKIKDKDGEGTISFQEFINNQNHKKVNSFKIPDTAEHIYTIRVSVDDFFIEGQNKISFSVSSGISYTKSFDINVQIVYPNPIIQLNEFRNNKTNRILNRTISISGSIMSAHKNKDVYLSFFINDLEIKRSILMISDGWTSIPFSDMIDTSFLKYQGNYYLKAKVCDAYGKCNESNSVPFNFLDYPASYFPDVYTTLKSNVYSRRK
ncbi:hypothetical protein TVAG_498950 [Trichomonas vaginalis G3]|uniref:EF-hand domain-containing protein n=1 Tax=Trichomonas vaginalis (strain ATCC PRA-98 / G3) TaxID=412133 RepID=A2FCK0_TRIV3|nr:EF-hand family [Trichomonas vaginalis G3]EAX97359.1 hypothetical protein TVAG_498950 [Trichomonas vaginalis G3]KAI5496519.1 EF-hand family [Trichomonas vaginalis G3]|eukprot:XP_001310289.1 hypothetical protein [Trichomonas vaginalis G3]